jgi:hypothetical protein
MQAQFAAGMPSTISAWMLAWRAYRMRIQWAWATRSVVSHADTRGHAHPGPDPLTPLQAAVVEAAEGGVVVEAVGVAGDTRRRRPMTSTPTPGTPRGRRSGSGPMAPGAAAGLGRA